MRARVCVLRLGGCAGAVSAVYGRAADLDADPDVTSRDHGRFLFRREPEQVGLAPNHQPIGGLDFLVVRAVQPQHGLSSARRGQLKRLSAGRAGAVGLRAPHAYPQEMDPERCAGGRPVERIMVHPGVQHPGFERHARLRPWLRLQLLPGALADLLQALRPRARPAPWGPWPARCRAGARRLSS